MKIFAATMKLNLHARPVIAPPPGVDPLDALVMIPAGSEVSAILVGADLWHINATVCGVTVERCCATQSLALGPLLATVNEGGGS